MFPVIHPVRDIQLRQFRGFDDQDILGVFLLCGLSEIKRSGNYCLAINNNYLVVSNVMSVIDEGWDPRIGQKCG